MNRTHALRAAAGQAVLFASIPSALLALARMLALALAQRAEAGLRQSMLNAIQREVADANPDATPVRLSPPSPDTAKLEIRADHLQLIENEYSTNADTQRVLDSAQDPAAAIAMLAGTNLMGQPTTTATVSLERAIQTAVANNLDTEVARYTPAINQSSIVEAQAAFDWLLFGSAAWQDSSTPQAGQGFGGAASVIRNESEVFTTQAGLSTNLTTGGSLSLTHSLNNTNVQSNFFGAEPSPNPAYASNFEVELNQPLLRGFGETVNLANIRLAENADGSSVAALRSQLITTITDTETAYWTLVQSYRELVIRTRLLERGVEVRDDILARRVQDARQAQIADAIARVERRRGDVLRARQAFRRGASDNLKRLVNDPSLPVGSETLLVPLDVPPAEEISVSLLDAITTAVAERPELDAALLSIDDAEIREQVARNLRKPRLDLQARAALLGLDDSFGNAYDDSVANRFVDDWLLGVTFEQPIGNRAAEAGFRRARLQRMQSVVSYRNAVQGVVLEVKAALDAVLTNHDLIEQSALSRIAQGEALRALVVEKELTNAGYTVEHLNLELNQQEALASAQIAESAAAIAFNTALADLYAAMGTALERARVDFIVPDANQLQPGELPMDYAVDPEPVSD